MPTDKNTIDSYDSYAEKWAERIRSGKNVAHTYLEKPAMHSKILGVGGLDVLCLGCGTGEECEYLKSKGAKSVVGVDLSGGLIDYARKSYPDLDFKVMDMEHLDFPEKSFDLVYSSLVMHYVDSWGKTLNSVFKILRPGGTFLFSTHHPAVWGAERKKNEAERTSILGYRKILKENKCEVLGDYLNTRKVDDVWFDSFKVSFVHRPMESMMGDIIKSKFVLKDFLEPRATEDCKSIDPIFWEIHQKIPLFMIFELKKKLIKTSQNLSKTNSGKREVGTQGYLK